MTKKHHQSDKLYISKTEHENFYGGKKLNSKSRNLSSVDYKIIPFTHCCISFQEAKNPYCDMDGHVFDLINILPFLKKFKINPVTGKPMTSKELFKITIHKNENNKIHCPVTYRIFDDKFPIVVNRISGNVYAKEAVDNFNIKLKSLRDLIDNTPFQQNDIITLFDPKNYDRLRISNFHHIQNRLTLKSMNVQQQSTVNLNNSSEYRMTMEQLKNRNDEISTKQISDQKTNLKLIKNSDTLSKASTGLVASSLTSTAVDHHTQAEHEYLEESQLIVEHINQNAYLTIETNLGKLNCELFCKERPLACENFIGLALQGYYDKTVFFRLEKDYFIQAGDHTGTGRFNDSFWGKPFKDEFRPFIPFDSAGCLAMANDGSKHSNGSQFFITMQALRQLDNKYSLFGKIVGGLDVLFHMNNYDVNESLRPSPDITIIKIECLNNPFEDARQLLESKKCHTNQKQTKIMDESKEKNNKINDDGMEIIHPQKIGKYLQSNIKNIDNIENSQNLDSRNSNQPETQSSNKINNTNNKSLKNNTFEGW